MDGAGKRFNQGKTRHDLVPAFAQEQYAKVITMGCEKYGERNWERGMKWSKILASLERHIQAIKRGEDYDPESGLLHSAHVMCNAGFLTEYYKIFPQGDDRRHWYGLRPKIGLDIDEVLADFVGSYTKRYKITHSVETWNFDPEIPRRLEELKNDKAFWMNMKPLINPKDLLFEPHCYITSRPCPVEVTQEWLYKHGFPNRPVYSTYKKSKVETCMKSGINWFIDDRFENFIDITNKTAELGNPVCCFLLDSPHNRRYDVGFKRIKTFQDLPLFN